MKKIIYISIILLALIFHNTLTGSAIKENSLPFQMGEKLVFSVDFGILNGGKYTMSIQNGESLGGKSVYTITSEANTNSVFDVIYKVRDVMRSYWDQDDLFSLRYVKRISEGGWQQYRVQYFFPSDTTAYDVKYKKGKPVREKFQALPFPQDELSIFYFMRCQKLEIGDSLHANIIASGEAYRTRIDIIGREKMKTIFGKIDCIKVKPFLKYIIKDNVEFFVWFTDDEYKIPVKLMVKVKYGKFTFNLKDAENVGLKIVD
ncbi:MAG: DUF3108 domain-containing protein [Candidatus Cloacimonadota bacterium]|nr:DUF3108 domain-containing protein [Candidatus Cloacimonadota bacterium]